MPYLPGRGNKGIPGRNLRVPVPLYTTFHKLSEIFRSRYLDYNAHLIPDNPEQISILIPEYLEDTLKDLIYLFTLDKTPK